MSAIVRDAGEALCNAAGDGQIDVVAMVRIILGSIMVNPLSASVAGKALHTSPLGVHLGITREEADAVVEIALRAVWMEAQPAVEVAR